MQAIIVRRSTAGMLVGSGDGGENLCASTFSAEFYKYRSTLGGRSRALMWEVGVGRTGSILRSQMRVRVYQVKYVIVLEIERRHVTYQVRTEEGFLNPKKVYR